MKRLISMTDFVLQDWSKYKGYDSEDYRVFAYNKNVIIENYATFLKQPLTLGMFVPCDENGNVLEEPDYDGFEVDINESYFGGETDIEIEKYELKYQKAKEKVLFNGDWEISNYKKWVLIESKKRSFSFYPFESDCLKIENLVDRDFELTESAIKEIGL